MRIDLFCSVVDNFGDAGVCWRLARQLTAEQGAAVRLWIDDLACLQRLRPGIRNDQVCDQVEIRHWPKEFPEVEPLDVVIEAFGCQLPPDFVEAMAKRSRPPVWINLEYLSAEEWVEGCHTLPSPHPRLPLTKYFFFPGFAERTGGLPRESNLSAARDAHLADRQGIEAFLGRLGITPAERLPQSTLVSLFCYDNPALPRLIEAWSDYAAGVLCLVPAGSRASVFDSLGLAPNVGAMSRRGSLHARVIPFVDQNRYDRLLWSCDINFVRGEDSFLRAQWAAKPFVWHAYPQTEEAHRLKLAAFLDRYLAGLQPETSEPVRRMFEAWNGVGDAGDAWDRFRNLGATLRQHAVEWDRRLSGQETLAARLASFCDSRLK